MSALVRVIDDLGAAMDAAGDVDIHLGHAPMPSLDQLAVTFLAPAAPGNVELSWSLRHMMPMSRFPDRRYLASGLISVVYDEAKQLLEGSTPFTVGQYNLLVLRLSRLQGVAASLGKTVVTVMFSEEE